MTALACLRILIDADRAAAGGETLALLVNKVASAFFETRWTWPRRYGEIAPYAFLLADPRLVDLDPSALTALSEELQLKLFGTEGSGAVTLAAMEGEQEIVTRFAAVDADELRRVLAVGGVIEGLTGRISEITADGVRVVSPPSQAGPLKPIQPARLGSLRAAPPKDNGVETRYRAIWCNLRETVTGNMLSARRSGSRTAFSTIDGPADMPGLDAAAYDIACLEAAPAALTNVEGMLFLPISFSSIIHRATRETYLEALEALPADARSTLVASVYGVPRAPTFTAIGQIKTFLDPYFGYIDLQTEDPDFAIEGLAMEAVNSVTLTLPDTDEGGRLAAATRFMANRDAYQRRRIWCALSNVRTRRELGFCIRQRAAFLSGMAVSETLVTPAPAGRCVATLLPVREDVTPQAQRMRRSG